jgi:L-ribulokinase
VYVSDERYVIGVDFGTLSGRAILVRVRDGAEIGAATYHYPHGVIDRFLPADTGPGGADGRELPPNWALQVPADYIGVLRHAIPELITATSVDPDDVIGIGTDFTACTVLPVLADGTPLCELPEYRDRPHAYVKLWKHHAAQPHADRINALAKSRQEPWLPRYGGIISSEWEFAKGLQLLEEDPEIYRRMDHFAEAADWIVHRLTGTYVRNACTAGYKGIYQDGRYPGRDFLRALNPDFEDFAAGKLSGPIADLGDQVGVLSQEAARWTGLRPGIAVATGNVDAHVTAPAAQTTEPGQLLAIMGTSTCHILNAATRAEVPGMCGVVDGGVVRGLFGYEAGQSGVGDIFAWFADSFYNPSSAERPGPNPREQRSVPDGSGSAGDLHERLSDLASRQRPGAHGLIALDWQSGNRSVLVDHSLSGVIVGMTLATKPEDVYRALIEATAFGTRKIVETFTASSVPVTEFVAAGGLLKNAFLMQVYADVLRMPVATCASEQAPALGSAIHAAVAAGAYPDVQAAGAAMGGRGAVTYYPDPAAADTYDRLYAEYERLHDYFGRGGNDVMHRLHDVKQHSLRNETSRKETHP